MPLSCVCSLVSHIPRILGRLACIFYILKTYPRVGLDGLLLVMTPEHSSGLYNLVAEHTAQTESAQSGSDSVRTLRKRPLEARRLALKIAARVSHVISRRVCKQIL
jgi:hypothetical protein